MGKEMKLLLLSDIHMLYQNPVGRLDNLTEIQWNKLEFVLEYAKKRSLIVLAAGDIFDRPRSWQLLSAVISILKQYDLQIFCVMGQHDTYLYSEETRDRTNLGILAKVGLIKILNDQPVKLGNSNLYGCSFGAEVPVPKSDGFNILVIHAPISDAPVYPGHEFTLAKDFLMVHDKYGLVLCGDIHRKFVEKVGGRVIMNVGPMLRKEATAYNFGHIPRFVVFDTETRREEWVDIPHMSAEEVLSRQHLEKQEETSNRMDDFIALIKEDVEQGVSFGENLRIFLKGNKIEAEVIDYLSTVMEGI